jgi:hypothetical protein
MIVCFEIFAQSFILSGAYVSVQPLVQIFIIFLYYAIELLSVGNGINFALIYLLNRGLKSDCVGRSALPVVMVLQQTLHIWILANK